MSTVFIPDGEIEICKYISSQLGHYYCYWYEDLNAAFFDGLGYGQNTNIADAEINPGAPSSKLLRTIIVLLRDAPQFGVITVQDIACCCRALGVPEMHVIYYSDQIFHLENNENVAQFVRLACKTDMNYLPTRCTKDPYVTEFNLLKAQYEGNCELHLHYATVYNALKQQQRAGNFVAVFKDVPFGDYETVGTHMRDVLSAPCMSEFAQDIKICKSYQRFMYGYVESANQTKLGNFLAVYNRYMVLVKCPQYCVMFDYKFEKIVKKRGVATVRPSKRDLTTEYLIRSMVSQPVTNCMHNSVTRVARHSPSYTLDAYQNIVKKHLNINFDLDNKEEGVFSIYTGIVLHANLLIKGPISTEKIINKPLVRFIGKHKTMTCSYYKEVNNNNFNWVKFNFNCQGEEFFIRGKLLVVYAKIKDVCDFGRSNDKLVISNQCGHIRGLHSGVINVHSYRTRMLYNEVNCFKVPSFPAIKLVDETQTNRSRDNIIHRETVLTRIHKDHSMLDNMTMIKNKMYPHCERVQEIHDLVYAVESRLRLVLIGPLLGILKMYYLYYGNDDKIVDTFVNRLWINQYVIAQNGVLSRAPMCHRIKDTTAIKCTSIKTVKKQSPHVPQPPIVDDPELLSLVAKTFEDVAVGALTPRLWKGRGAFSYLNVLIQAPTRTVYSELGVKFVSALYDMLDRHGGRSEFQDCYKLLDIYRSFQKKKKNVD